MIDSGLSIPLESDHIEIAKRIVEYLKTHKEVDVRVFMGIELGISWADHDVVNRVANELRKEKRYSIKAGGIGDTNTYIISTKDFSEKHPYWQMVIAGLITAVFSLIVGWLLLLPQNQEQDRIDTLQNVQIQHLSDSLNNLQKHIMDSYSRGDSSEILKK